MAYPRDRARAAMRNGDRGCESPENALARYRTCVLKVFMQNTQSLRRICYLTCGVALLRCTQPSLTSTPCIPFLARGKAYEFRTTPGRPSQYAHAAAFSRHQFSLG